jgi:hypothetical protein
MFWFHSWAIGKFFTYPYRFSGGHIPVPLVDAGQNSDSWLSAGV